MFSGAGGARWDLEIRASVLLGALFLLNQLLLLLLLLLGYADAVSSAGGTSSGMSPFRFLSYICPSSISKVFFFFLRSSSISKVATEKKG